jgi:hypothetical protein
MKKEEERKLARKIVRGVAKEFRSRGFLHAKPTFIVRPFEGFAQFVHFHKFTFGPQFRAHFGVRVMNDPFVAVALNGPAFEHAGTYGPDEERSLACTRQLIALVEEEGLSWFSQLSSVEDLLKSSKSPLDARDRRALLEGMRGQKNEASWQLSERLLGLTREKEA